MAAWIGDVLRHGSLWSDAVVLRQAYRAQARLKENAAQARLREIAALAYALCLGAERRLETAAQGAAFALAARPWGGGQGDWGEVPLPYPVAVAELGAARGAGEADLCLAYLHAGVANLVSAAVRLIPLGQASGLRVQADSEAAILEVLALSESATMDDLGTCCFAGEIAAMRHETQHTRLFRS